MHKSGANVITLLKAALTDFRIVKLISMEKQLANNLSNLNPISLSQLDHVKLLNRVDRKYIIPLYCLPEIIRLLNENQYSILEIDGHRAFSYSTTYFDTSDYRFYKDHHNHLASRIKVRTRTYKENNLHFFEIKMKTNVRTNKLREALERPGSGLSDYQRNKIESLYSKELCSSLIPSLANSFKRITLVNKAQTERCTIDVNISFRDPEVPEKEISIKNIAIIEVKQSKSSVLNGIIASLRTMRIYPSGISKYVLGLFLTHPDIKHNYFKPLLQKIEKIQTQQLALA